MPPGKGDCSGLPVTKCRSGTTMDSLRPGKASSCEGMVVFFSVPNMLIPAVLSLCSLKNQAHLPCYDNIIIQRDIRFVSTVNSGNSPGALTRHKDARIRGDTCHYLTFASAQQPAQYIKPLLQDQDPDTKELVRESLQTLEELLVEKKPLVTTSSFSFKTLIDFIARY